MCAFRLNCLQGLRFVFFSRENGRIRSTWESFLLAPANYSVQAIRNPDRTIKCRDVHAMPITKDWKADHA